MSKPIAVIPVELSERLERIKAFHAGTLNAFRDQMGYAFLAGVELNALKETTAHGDFGPLRKEFLGDIPERTQRQYMKFADMLQSKSATVADLAKQPLLLTDGHVAEADAKKICKAVHDAADGKTLTEMYRDLGVIRPVKDAVHHPRKAESAKDAAEADKAQARLWVAHWLGKARTLLAHPTLATRLTREQRDLIEGTNIAVNKFLAGKLPADGLKTALTNIEHFMGEDK